MQYEGVSEAITQCLPLIRKKALNIYGRIGYVNRRWIDPEDLIQEGMLAAINAESPGRFNPKRKVKYITYLWNALRLHYSGQYLTPLRQQKRIMHGLIELDAPVEQDGKLSRIDLLPGNQVGQDEICAAVKALVAVCGGLSRRGIDFLVGGLLCGKWEGDRIRKADKETLIEIQLQAKRAGVNLDDLRILLKNEDAKKSALAGVASLLSRVGADNMGTADETAAKILECLECRKQFTLEAIRERRYFVSTLTCRRCLLRMQRSVMSCFGKVKKEGQEGYSEADVECRLHCRDRKVCRYFKENKMKKAAEVEELDDEELAGVDEALGELDDLEVEEEEAEEPEVNKSEKSKEVAKAEKKSKVVKKAKAKKEKHGKPELVKEPKKAAKGKEKEAEEDEESHLPWRKGSMMRYLFSKIYKAGGASEKSLADYCKELGFKWPFQKKCLLAGMSGKLENPTHRWKVKEEDGRLIAYDLKSVAGYKKPERKAPTGKKAKAKPEKEKKAKVTKKAKAKKEPKVAKAAGKKKTKAVAKAKKVEKKAA